MNFVYLSPHFPPNYYQFCLNLQRCGATVLGLADEPYDRLNPELRGALAEYYWVPDMHNYDGLLRAMGHFINKFGRMDRIDSHNEYWLETEARLRTDFNMPGFHVEDLPAIKRKSEMKKKFAEAQVEAPPCQIIETAEQAWDFVGRYGYPVVAKPDIGVGAARTYRIDDKKQLAAFLSSRPLGDYILEKFVQGTMQTFDGLTDQQGNIVFYTSHQYSQGIMETVNEDTDVYYYSLREIPLDVAQAGQRIVKAFGIKERFFHFEFFRTPDNRVVALEVNMRPPGGWTTDMFDFANDIDIYHEWANVVVNNQFVAKFSWPYHCCYVGRKWNKQYAHTHDEIMARYGQMVVHHEEISGIFSAALGNFGYLTRSPNLDEIVAAAQYILAK